jgi:hypothetical protein
MSQPGYRNKIWNAKGAYTDQLGIGPVVIQILSKFPYSGGV